MNLGRIIYYVNLRMRTFRHQEKRKNWWEFCCPDSITSETSEGLRPDYVSKSGCFHWLMDWERSMFPPIFNRFHTTDSSHSGETWTRVLPPVFLHRFTGEEVRWCKFWDPSFVAISLHDTVLDVRVPSFLPTCPWGSSSCKTFTTRCDLKLLSFQLSFKIGLFPLHFLYNERFEGPNLNRWPLSNFEGPWRQ